MKIPCNTCGSFFFLSSFFHNNPNLVNPSSGITRPKKTKRKRTIAIIMVVHVCGTGCQTFVENDHKLGCAASVEHTPHPLSRPSSYMKQILIVMVMYVLIILLCCVQGPHSRLYSRLCAQSFLYYNLSLHEMARGVYQLVAGVRLQARFRMTR